MSETTRNLRGRVAALSRDRSFDDPELVAARRDLRAARLEEHARDVAREVELTPAQRARIVVAVGGTELRFTLAEWEQIGGAAE